jgi:hypothetical protein
MKNHMNPLIQLKSAIVPLLLTFTLPWFALSPVAQAVVPAPDGGYPNFTTAEGTKALQSLTTGPANTAVGWFSLSSNTEGSFNTAIGAGTLLFNIGDQNTGDGTENTATGAVALFSNTTGTFNTALGANAGDNVSTASGVICIGSGGADVSYTTWIGGVYGVTTQSGTTAPVVVSDTGQLGTAASSERFKKDIATMERPVK